MQGFPGIIGAVDGSHIPIRTPTEYPENYINRKGFPSVILQAVCDHNMRFIDIYCGWPGSVHDARVLRNSPLCEKADDNADDIQEYIQEGIAETEEVNYCNDIMRESKSGLRKRNAIVDLVQS
ncbi:putative nuclease HARBI1 [Mya arenaria]|uniref:putative nuclease HARBI1 n=1 Tax=Mya arenaria TaxID=6604 RepID=UPI0022E6236A|nr:putative nuclease HARBI1 [Mya arenaria]